MGTSQTDLRMDVGRIADESIARVSIDSTVFGIARGMVALAVLMLVSGVIMTNTPSGESDV